MRDPFPSIAIALLVMLMPGLAGCEPDSEVVSEGDYLYFETIGIGQTGSVSEVAEWVVRDSTAWIESSARLRPLAPFSSVDFDQYQVIVVAIPEESGGYNVEVESIEIRPDEVIVDYILREPASDCITLAAEAVPFQAIKVRKFDQPVVRFEQTVAEYRCTWKQRG